MEFCCGNARRSCHSVKVLPAVRACIKVQKKHWHMYIAMGLLIGGWYILDIRFLIVFLYQRIIELYTDQCTPVWRACKHHYAAYDCMHSSETWKKITSWYTSKNGSKIRMCPWWARCHGGRVSFFHVLAPCSILATDSEMMTLWMYQSVTNANRLAINSPTAQCKKDDNLFRNENK